MFQLSLHMRPVTSCLFSKHLIIHAVLLTPLLGTLDSYARPSEDWTSTGLEQLGNQNWDEDPNDDDISWAIITSLEEWENMRKQEGAATQIGHIHKRSIVCYDDIGCFKDEGTFAYLRIHPDSPEDINTKFILFTKGGAADGELLWYTNSSSLFHSQFNSEKPTKVVIHGFGGGIHEEWVMQMVNAILKSNDVNVIVVDWEKGSALPNFVKAVANCHLVGMQLATLIKMINNETGLTNEDFHLIGFSLGAHIAGYAGSECRNISRITGLDPAGMMFEGHPISAKLDPSDATIVDVIHSTSNNVFNGGFGAYEPLGDLDFYPNGGSKQISCNNIVVNAITDLISRSWRSLCSHRRAVRFFIDSINPSCKFPAFPCDSYENFLAGKCFMCDGEECVNMGYHLNQSLPARGTYFLATRDMEPFCANQFRISISTSKGQGVTWGTLEITFQGGNDSNETFIVGDEVQKMNDGENVQSLIVADPGIQNITGAILKYTKHNGWFYYHSGHDGLYIDKIQVIDSNGGIMSSSGQSLFMLDKETRFVPLFPEAEWM